MGLWSRFKERTALFLAAMVLLDPKKGPALVLRNCIRLDGRWHPQRSRIEIRDLLKVVAVGVSLPLIYIAVSLGAVWAVNQYIVPLPFVFKLATVFHVGEESWEANIDDAFGSMGEVAKEYEAWGRKRGMSTPTAKLMEKTLWHGWPIYLGLGIFLGLNGYLLCIRLIVKYVRRYRQHLRKRKEYYYDKDLEAIPRDRLLF
ncbi:MAG: hypothetical protein P8010_17015 [Desulfosarcinaceae bacterium]|jgi:hypothetical protein